MLRSMMRQATLMPQAEEQSMVICPLQIVELHERTFQTLQQEQELLGLKLWGSSYLIKIITEL